MEKTFEWVVTWFQFVSFKIFVSLQKNITSSSGIAILLYCLHIKPYHSGYCLHYICWPIMSLFVVCGLYIGFYLGDNDPVFNVLDLFSDGCLFSLILCNHLSSCEWRVIFLLIRLLWKNLPAPSLWLDIFSQLFVN